MAVRPGVKAVRARPASAGPTASVAEAKAKITPARAAAFEILTLVGERKGHSDELLHSARTAELSPEDRNLATALVMGVLRWQIALDARIAKLLARPDQQLAEPVALALRMGAFQLLHLDRIPAHAALSESVEMCRAAGHPHATGMVNAVLRKISEPMRHPSRSAPIFESAKAFAERLGHPLWLVERWVAAHGRAAALAICEYDQKEPDGGGLFVDAESGSTAGEAAPQMDDGSRLVAEIAAAAVPVLDGRAARVWDCCAAPGGKTLMLARRLEGAEILATDVSAKRMAAMEARLRRFAYAERVRCGVADAAAGPGENPILRKGAKDEAPGLRDDLRDDLKDGAPRAVPEEFDLILCDVPCSGTGTLARNPEIRLRLHPEEFDRQSARQRAILAGALRRLAPGGRLVYSTCSLEPEENERVVEAVAAEAGLRRVPAGPLLQGLADRGMLRSEAAEELLRSGMRDEALRTLPGVHGCDGFYAVVLERTG
jgi:16S rRNA (cytosine967-C5)-methyltransferase